MPHENRGLDSANFWLAVGGLLLAGGTALIVATADHVGDKAVSPLTLTGFAGGCLMTLLAAMTLVAGLALFFADRIVERRLAPTPASEAQTTPTAVPPPQPSEPSPSSPGPVVVRAPTGRTPPLLDYERLIGFFDGRTHMQGQKLVEPWIGARVSYQGAVKNVRNGLVSSNPKPSVAILMRFSEEWADRIARLQIGDPILIDGTITEVEPTAGGWIGLADCAFATD